MKAYDISYQFKAKKSFEKMEKFYFLGKNCSCRDKKCDLGKYPTNSNERGLILNKSF